MTLGIVEFVLTASAAEVLSAVGAVMRAGVAPGLFVTVCDDGPLPWGLTLGGNVDVLADVKSVFWDVS